MLYMGFGMALDPVRLGVVLLLTSRPRPMLNLFVFWLGGLAAGVVEAVFVLVFLHDFAQGFIRHVTSAIDGVRSSVVIFTGAHLQITVGVVTLVAIAALRVRERARIDRQVAVGGGGVTTVVEQPRGLSALLAWLAARTHDMLKSNYVWPVFIAGLSSSIPPVEGLAALGVIMASRADLGTQVSGFLVWTMLLLTIIEVPLVCYLVRPHKTLALIMQVQHWLQGHIRQIMQFVFTGFGVCAVVQGLVSL